MRKVLVLGLGKVGSLVGVLCKEYLGFEVVGMDMTSRPDLPFDVFVGDVTNEEALRKAISGQWAVISCLPYYLNVAVARIARMERVHYFDLTEDVEATHEIRKMSVDADCLMAPQCGLAPGFIGIVGASLAQGFQTLRSIELRVGALPQHPSGLLGYAFIWSPEGVVNEYLNDCEVIQDGIRKVVPAMEALETVVIGGVHLEAFTTSGGLGTMCETFEGRVQELNYKTMRYPRHCELMRFFFHELLMKTNRQEAGRILVEAKPPVSDDVVYVHAAVTGKKDDQLIREEFVRAYKPLQIAGKSWRAISWTTAASVCAIVQMIHEGLLPQRGFLKQEDISLEQFLQTETGRLYRH